MINRRVLLAALLDEDVAGFKISRNEIDDHAKMADQERSSFYIFFTMILCALRSLEMLITLLSELIWVSNQTLVLTEAIWSLQREY